MKLGSRLLIITTSHSNVNLQLFVLIKVGSAFKLKEKQTPLRTNLVPKSWQVLLPVKTYHSK